MTTPREKWRYLYCVIDCPERKGFGKIGFDESDVYTIPYKGIAAAVSDESSAEYEPSEDATLAHERVIEDIMRKHTVIPAAFGNVFLTEDRVRWLLRSLHAQFKRYLEKLRNRVEIGLKVFLSPEDAKREFEKMGRKAERLKSEIAARTPGELGEATKRLLESVEVEEWARDEFIVRCYYAEKVYRPLRERVDDARVGSLIGNRMVLNGAFLVSSEKAESFKQKVRKLEGGYVGKGLDFQISGPWPPYSFACIRVRADGSVAIT